MLPFWDSLAVMAALKLFVAALGAFLLARAFGMRFAGAFLCGLVFGFSLWSVTWVSWTTMSVWALLPWLCLLAELCVRRPGPLPFAGLATATGLQFLGGHPSIELPGDGRGDGVLGRAHGRLAAAARAQPAAAPGHARRGAGRWGPRSRRSR